MITLLVLIYTVWTIARFRKGLYMGMGKDWHDANPFWTWYVFMWDVIHLAVSILFIGYIFIKYLP